MESEILKQILTELQSLNDKYDKVLEINQVNQKQFKTQQNLAKILILVMIIAFSISIFLIR